MANELGLHAVAETTGKFANNFFKEVVNDNPGNLITSPLSAQIALAMAAYGADGMTATQMRSVLLIPSEDDLGRTGYQSIIETLNVVKGVDLRLANKIYTASQFEVKLAYKALTSNQFLSSSQEVDFNSSAAAAETINTWCEEQTNKRIKNVITSDCLNSDTRLVLVNAVYFKGQWEKKFDPSSTHDKPFHIDEKTTKDVPTMFVKRKFRTGSLPELNASFIEIPYQGNELSMIIIVPHEVNGLKTVQENLYRVNLSQSVQQSSARDVDLFLPKFKIESTLNLEETLKKLGMTKMFENGADFSGIADVALKISNVCQKAFIEVNEEGSEAAAATVARIQKRKGPPIFEVDCPFYFQIGYTSLNVPLFTGQCTDPSL